MRSMLRPVAALPPRPPDRSVGARPAAAARRAGFRLSTGRRTRPEITPPRRPAGPRSPEGRSLRELVVVLAARRLRARLVLGVQHIVSTYRCGFKPLRVSRGRSPPSNCPCGPWLAFAGGIVLGRLPRSPKGLSLPWVFPHRQNRITCGLNKATWTPQASQSAGVLRVDSKPWSVDEVHARPWEHLPLPCRVATLLPLGCLLRWDSPHFKNPACSPACCPHRISAFRARTAPMSLSASATRPLGATPLRARPLLLRPILYGRSNREVSEGLLPVVADRSWHVHDRSRVGVAALATRRRQTFSSRFPCGHSATRSSNRRDASPYTRLVLTHRRAVVSGYFCSALQDG